MYEGFSFFYIANATHAVIVIRTGPVIELLVCSVHWFIGLTGWINGSKRFKYIKFYPTTQTTKWCSGNSLRWEPCVLRSKPPNRIYYLAGTLPHVSLSATAHGRFWSVHLNKNRPVFYKNRRFDRIFSGSIAGWSFTWTEPAGSPVPGSTGRTGRSSPVLITRYSSIAVSKP